MKIDLEPGTYVVAVSGGVDSMVLLDLLAKLALSTQQLALGKTNKAKSFQLVVAHLDHGIRPDSDQDRHLVEAAAEKYGLPFVFDEGKLGPKASEASAREARYKFLRSVVEASGAKAIVTAHHQDDMLETAIINMLRGTGRKGLSSLRDLPTIKRPLLKFNKAEIIDYAKKHNLKWREDSTNQDTNYLRNYIRHKIIPKLTDQQQTELLNHIDQVGELNKEIDSIIDSLVGRQSELDRQWFISLDHAVAMDVMASWLRSRSIKDFDSKRLELLVRAAKTYQPSKQIDIDKTHILKINNIDLALTSRER